jgi:hypothetical protein
MGKDFVFDLWHIEVAEDVSGISEWMLIIFQM